MLLADKKPIRGRIIRINTSSFLYLDVVAAYGNANLC